MSTSKHRLYRQVLSIQRGETEYGSETVPYTAVVWCTRDTLTSRTVKTKHVAVSVYVGGPKHNGVTARMPKRLVSISLKAPLDSKVFTEPWCNVDRMIQSAFNDAYRSYITAPERAAGLTGTVRWFSGDTGAITCNRTGQVYRVYACNIQGAKTWFPETACMYLKAGETVTFDLADMGDHVSACKVRGNVYFDEARWNSLDQSRLAFRCDENGTALNGLFSSGGAE